MSTDLTLLVWAVGLTMVQAALAAMGALLLSGPGKMAGNRDDLPPITGWAGRATRAHRNMLESLPLFAALVLTAQIAGKADATSALGSELFFWARLVYAPVYVIGIPFLRTAVWAVSIVGLITIFVHLV
jgi:uncharacterized MAPEG superfamily protein